jgi:hypothetical protein
MATGKSFDFERDDKGEEFTATGKELEGEVEPPTEFAN